MKSLFDFTFEKSIKILDLIIILFICGHYLNTEAQKLKKFKLPKFHYDPITSCRDIA